MKLYGPYTRKDGRKHFVVFNDDGTTTSLSYPKWLMEQHLGRKLTDDETVDHINNDFTDDRLENLQILSRKENAAKEFLRKERQQKLYEFICPICGTMSTKPLSIVLNNRKKGAKGPFCSKSCAGKASHL